MAEPGKKRKSEPHGCKWADNYDIFSSEFTDDPFSLWDKMREGDARWRTATSGEGRGCR